jgi:hypothetical protein
MPFQFVHQLSNVNNPSAPLPLLHLPELLQFLSQSVASWTSTTFSLLAVYGGGTVDSSSDRRNLFAEEGIYVLLLCNMAGKKLILELRE